MAAWFGLLVGLLEVAVMATQKLVFGKILHVARDFVWMTPAAELALFLLVGAVFAVASLRWPRLAAPRTAAFVLAMLGILGLFLFYPKLHVLAMLLLAAGAAAQIARVAATRADAFDRLVRRTTPMMAGLVLLLGLGLHAALWWNERRALARLPTPAPGAPSVLLVVLDTVRAQNLSLHGYERRTSPELERLAAEGVRFDYALSTAPWTLPAHATMMTGRWPHELSSDWGTPLDGTHPTLAEAFSARGYRTAGFVANAGWVGWEHGVDRGFSHYEDYPVTPIQMVASTFVLRLAHLIEREALNAARSREKQTEAQPGNQPPPAYQLFRKQKKGKLLKPLLNNYGPLRKKTAPTVDRQFLDWLGEGGTRPYFVFLNYMEAHDPYSPAPPFDRQFGPTRPEPESGLAQTVRAALTPAEQRDLLVNAYDGALATLDRELERLLAELRSRGALENTLVIVTSDHGEQLGEHGLIFHANSLYIQLLHVPLLIWFPERVPAGVTVPDYVSLRDLPATVLDLADIRDAGRFPGVSLSRFWQPQAAPAATPPGEALLAEVSKGIRTPAWWPVSKGDMKSLVMEQVHYIRNGDGLEELYDLSSDPFEERDLAGSSEGRAEVGRFRLKLETAFARAGTAR
jgi:arylsulfatase A-like enzyme